MKLKNGAGLILSLLLFISHSSTASASEFQRLDYETCRMLVEQNEILSIMELSERVQELRLGHLIDMMLIQTADDYIYEMEIAESSGEIKLFYVDARNGHTIASPLDGGKPESTVELFERIFENSDR